MDETLTLINQILEEHKLIIKRVQNLEQAANDAEALLGLERAKEQFVPGRFDQRQSLQKLQEWLETIDEGLQAHFNREETALLTAVEKHGDKELASDWRSLLLEHEDLRNRFAHSREHVAELISGRLSRQLWEAGAHDMRAHISHTRKLLEAHAEIERKLLQTLRSKLVKREKRS